MKTTCHVCLGAGWTMEVKNYPNGPEFYKEDCYFCDGIGKADYGDEE